MGEVAKVRVVSREGNSVCVTVTPHPGLPFRPQIQALPISTFIRWYRGERGIPVRGIRLKFAKSRVGRAVIGWLFTLAYRAYSRLENWRFPA